MEGFVLQVGRLEGDDRSLFLSTALRNGSGRNIENLVDAVSHLSGEQLSHFLETADGLGRTRESLKAGEQQNFIQAAAAMAGDSPATVDRLITRVDSLSENPDARSGFLSTAVRAGDGFNDFLSVAGKLGGPGRAKVLSFAADLGFTGLTSFIEAAKHDTANAVALVETAVNLDDKSQSYLLYAAAQNPDHQVELTATAQRLNGDEQKDFLFAAANMAARDPTDPDAPDPMQTFLRTTNELAASRRGDFLAEKAGKGVLPELVSVTARLDEERSRAFVDYANTLGGKSISNLVVASEQALKTPGNEFGAFDRLMETVTNLDTPVENHGNLRPSDLIRDGVFQGELPLEGFFKSSLFLVSVGAGNTHMNDWFNTWQGIPKQV